MALVAGIVAEPEFFSNYQHFVPAWTLKWRNKSAHRELEEGQENGDAARLLGAKSPGTGRGHAQQRIKRETDPEGGTMSGGRASRPKGNEWNT
jgi:hypothetical protein